VGVNVGVEIDGKNNDFERPVLIVKKFNDEMFWGIPLTSKLKQHPYVLEVQHDGGISFANVSQLRLCSSKRMLRKIGMISSESYNHVLGSIITILTPKKSSSQ
jgi:mRNA interferase MazF